jgi:hypothetical protein
MAVLTTIDVNVPETLMTKLNAFASRDLSKDEAAILNAVFDVYSYAVNNRCSVFKEDPAFIKEMNQYEDNQLQTIAAITPTWTIVTITTVIASHPIITCSRAITRRCE